jgi:hypothetical protein
MCILSFVVSIPVWVFSKCLEMEMCVVLIFFRCLVMSFAGVRVGGGGCQSRSDSAGDIERSDGTARVGIAS